MFRVKICGLTRPEDVQACVDAGADAIGFQMSRGPRKITPQAAKRLARAVPAGTLKVGVFVDEPASHVTRIARECGFDLVQLHGDETALQCAATDLPVLKAIRMRNVKTPNRYASYPVAGLLLDRYNPKFHGGTGLSFDWSWARAAGRLRMPILLAGGLRPDNVAKAIRAARPFGVDTASGVEVRPGIKDRRLISLFVHRAKAAFLQG